MRIVDDIAEGMRSGVPREAFLNVLLEHHALPVPNAVQLCWVPTTVRVIEACNFAWIQQKSGVSPVRCVGVIVLLGVTPSATGTCCVDATETTNTKSLREQYAHI